MTRGALGGSLPVGILTGEFSGWIARAKSRAQLNEIHARISTAWAANQIADAEAQRLLDEIEERRKSSREKILGRVAVSPQQTRKRPQRSPDRERSLARRRRLAVSGVMPPTLAANFTTGELAVLRIVADECRDNGCCKLSLGELGARSGSSASTAKNALKKAHREELVRVEERRRGRTNLANVIKIISNDWQGWISRQRRPSRAS